MACVQMPTQYSTRQHGFTYIGLLILLAMIGATTVAALQVGNIAGRRQAQEELLQIGDEFATALASYKANTVAGQRDTPHSLEELLDDLRPPAPLPQQVLLLKPMPR